MNEESIKVRALECRASKFIHDVFCLFGHVSNTNAFLRIAITSAVGLLLSTGIFTQVALLVKTNYELAVIIDVVPSMFGLFAGVIYLPIGYANRHKYKKLLMMLRMNEGQKRTEREERIKEKYDRYIMTISRFVIIFTVVESVGLLTPAFVPPILDYIVPLNESRRRALPFLAEYFVDQEEYFYEILLFQYIKILAVFIMLATVDTTFILYMVFACGMFSILGYKMENITGGEDGDKQKYIYQDKELTSRIREFVESHILTLKLVELLTVWSDKLLQLLLAGTFIMLSICLAQVLNPHLVTVRSVLMGVATLAQFFIISFAGQMVIDASERLPQNTYNSNWYLCSAKVQKYFILLLMKTNKPCTVATLNNVVISYQNFLTVIQTGVSFAMILKQCSE